MFVENPDAFKTWLTAVLEPLCDADPAALAKYVYALVKKDKPRDDLRDGMIDQLDVFLQDETKKFVDLLFKSLTTQEYLNPPSITETEDKSNSNVALNSESTRTDDHEHNNITSVKSSYVEVLKDEKIDIASNKNDRKDLNLKDKEIECRGSKHVESKKDASSKQRIVLNRATKFVPATVPKEKPAYATEQTLVKVIPDILEDSLNEQLPIRNAKRDRKSDSDKEDRRRRQFKSRSRSRSWDRVRRPAGSSRSLWRNRSPPSQNNRYERRRSRSGSPLVRAPRYRNRSPPPSDSDVPTNRSRSRSRERVLSPVPNSTREHLSRERERDRQSRTRDRVDRDKIIERDREREERGGRNRDCVSGTATPTQDSNPGDSGPQVRGATTLAGIFTPTQKKRCRDFDEKGYCMRGDLCQYDHGTDPVVLEDALSHMLAIPMARPPPRHPTPEYNPSAPDIWARGATAGTNIYSAPPPSYFPFANAPRGHHPVQRELIPVPIARVENVPPNNIAPPVMNNALRATMIAGAPLAPVAPPNNHSVPPPLQPLKKKTFDFNRLGPNRHHIQKIPGGNCSLELKKVPRGLNDIMHLNNHFSKFGKIVNIQVCYEDDPEAALITFSSHTEANVAYKSTEAVLNNRFIKVFWHNSEQSKQENMPPGSRVLTKEKMANHTHINNNNVNHVSHNKVLINKENIKVTNNASSETKVTNSSKDELLTEIKKDGEEAISTIGKDPLSVVSVADTTVKQESSVPATAELAALVRKRGEGAAKLARDLRRRSQQLIDKQLQQQRILIKRLESGTCTGTQREILLATIKSMQKSIEKTKKELVSHPKSLTSQPEDKQMSISMGKMSLSSAFSTKNLMVKKASFGSLKKTPKSKEETQKEILDTELDIITKQQEGQDVTELQKKVAELKRQQLSLKTSTPVRRSSINRLSARGRFNKSSSTVKSGMFINQSVDHRPRSFLVSGYESDELEQLIQHFTQYGEIVEHIADPTTPSLWLQFRSRKIAEQAATKGRQFNDRTLTVTWQPKSTTISQSGSEKKNAEYTISPGSANKPSSPMMKLSTQSMSLSEEQSEACGLSTPMEEFLAMEMSHEALHSPSYHYPDSEDDEGKDYDKEEERSWRR